MKRFDIDVEVSALAPIMFDKFYDQSKTKRSPEEKLYLRDNVIVFPAINIRAFYACQRTGCIRVFEGKQWQDYYRAFQAFVRITSDSFIPFLDEKGKEITFDHFNEKMYIYTTNVIVGSGQKKSRDKASRPVLRHPWIVRYKMVMFENELIDVKRLEGWTRTGGFLIAWGNGRPEYGRFEVTKWEVQEN